MRIDIETKKKYDTLTAWFSRQEKAVIAFSGGVDSTLLLYAAHAACGENALAVTVLSPLLPQKERGEAEEFCKCRGIRQKTLSFDPFSVDGFSDNPKDRCYHCKKQIFTGIKAIANEEGITCVCEGSNKDDLSDYRPGMRAIEEFSVKSPLLETGLSKAEIRSLSEYFGLPTFDKPSMACLASRIPYGQEITAEKLSMIDRAEAYLFEKGFSQCRVRHHGEIARIEVLSGEIPRLLSEDIRMDAEEKLKDLGFKYVTVDLQGYRTGSLN